MLIGRSNVVTRPIIAQVALVHAEKLRELAPILAGQRKAATHWTTTLYQASVSLSHLDRELFVEIGGILGCYSGRRITITSASPGFSSSWLARYCYFLMKTK